LTKFDKVTESLKVGTFLRHSAVLSAALYDILVTSFYMYSTSRIR